MAVALLICPQALLAWSSNGHRTVAIIAWNRLSDGAKINIQSVLNGLAPHATLADLSVCADQLRGLGAEEDDCTTVGDSDGLAPSGVCGKFSMQPQSASWHFIDVPITASPREAADMEAYCPNANCVVDQIRAESQALQKDPQDTTSLMFLVHFVGDLHQPLHCATEFVDGVDDRGGNNKKITWTESQDPKYPLNLHSLWDHLVAPSDNVNDPVALSGQLERALQGMDVTLWTQGDYVGTAALETFQIAQTHVYPDYYGKGPDGPACFGSTLGASYHDAMEPIVNERLEKAGVRLAALLEQAFGSGDQPSRARRQPKPLKLPQLPERPDFE